MSEAGGYLRSSRVLADHLVSLKPKLGGAQEVVGGTIGGRLEIGVVSVTNYRSMLIILFM